MIIKNQGKTVKKIDTPKLNQFHRELHSFLSNCESINALKNFIEKYHDLAICITEQYGEFVAVNHAFTELYGYSKDELLGEHCTMVVPPKYKPLAVEYHNQVVRSRQLMPTVCVNCNKKGENIVLIIAPISYQDPDTGKLFIVSALEPKRRQMNGSSNQADLERKLASVI
ncbi:MAG: PAS domain S-box protein [Bacteroidia bacterium]|nr:PAS domain S-box protein [Bacteroidia bacterium]MDW8159078.1 PAS domain S-box protein [Bacteroidia bacterium]